MKHSSQPWGKGGRVRGQYMERGEVHMRRKERLMCTYLSIVWDMIKSLRQWMETICQTPMGSFQPRAAHHLDAMSVLEGPLMAGTTGVEGEEAAVCPGRQSSLVTNSLLCCSLVHPQVFPPELGEGPTPSMRPTPPSAGVSWRVISLQQEWGLQLFTAL